VRSNRGMDDAHLHEQEDPVAQRLRELEIKASFAEDLLDQLNLMVYQQQQQIDSLLREVARLRQQAPEPGAFGARNPRDELPPHY